MRKKMKNGMKKLLAVLLAVCLLTTFVPGGTGMVLADPVGVETEGDLRNAIENVVEGDIISINGNVALTADLIINKSITLTSISDSDTLNAGDYAITVPAGREVTFDGGLAVIGGTAGAIVDVAGSFTLGGSASVTQTGTSSSGAVRNNGGTVAITGNTVVMSAHTGINNASGTLTVTGGMVIGAEDGIKSYGTLNVSNGTIGSTNEVKNGVRILGGAATISGGNIRAMNYAVSVGSSGTVNISGGSFTAGDSDQYALQCLGAANLTDGSFTGIVATDANGTLDITSGTVVANTGVSYKDSGHPRPFLASLPTLVTDAEVGTTTNISLTGAYTGVVYNIDTTETDNELGALKVSDTAFTLTPTDAGSYHLVLTSAAGSQSLKLTIPVTVTASSLPLLAVPANPVWDTTTPGKAKWDAVANASGYSVQLYKGGTVQGGAINVAAGTVGYDFTAAITTTGSYTFKVTAIGDGTAYSDSPSSAASPAYSYIVPTAVCEVSSVPIKAYTSLTAALTEVEDGQTITLLQPINHNTDTTANVITIDNKTVIFNLAGYTLNVGSASASQAIIVKNGGKLELFDDSGELNVTAYGHAVEVRDNGSSAVVTSATSVNNIGAVATNGGQITVRGDAVGKTSGAYAVGAVGKISKVTVGRDAKSTGANSAAAQARNGGQVTVNRNVIATGNNSWGVEASENGSKVHVKGYAQGVEYGVDANLSAEVTVDGDVSTGSVGTAYGVRARAKAKVIVKGNVSANNNSGSIGAYAQSTSANTPTEITIEGTISGTNYIKLNNVVRNNDPAARTIPSTKGDYHTYTLTDGNGTHTVWVKDTAPPDGATLPTLSAGYQHALAIMESDGTLRAWGWNASGQLGTQQTGDIYSIASPVTPPDLSDIIAVAGGYAYSLALKNDGTVWAWGGNNVGQLGNNSTTSSYTPVQVSGLTEVTAIAAGYEHSLALKADGTVWSWGYGYYGQLGDGDYGVGHNSLIPVQVQGLTEVKEISVSNNGHYCLALKADGTVWSWGLNQWGRLGDGTETNRSTPVQVSGLSGITGIAAGYGHALAVGSGGSVWAWGDNGGKFGNGTTTNSLIPVEVAGLTGVSSVSAGNAHSLFLKTEGTVLASGQNIDGQLGNGTTVGSNTPVQVSGLTGAVDISAGGSYSLALRNDGTVWGWGSNMALQLGNVSYNPSAIPVQIQLPQQVLWPSYVNPAPVTASVTGFALSPANLPQSGGMVSATVTGANLNISGTDLKVSLNSGITKIGTVSGNTGTSATITFDVPENGITADRVDTVSLYLNGVATGHSSTVTVALGDSVPTAPQNFTATLGNGQVELSWTAPAGQGDNPITRYEVSNDNGATWVTADTNISHTFTGLTNGTAYTFQVRAVNSDGEGAAAIITAIPVEGGAVGATWNYRSPLPASNIMEKAEFINSQYMAVGYNGALITSPDGINWEKVDVGTDTDRLNGIASNGSGKYVIVGTASDYVARIYTSDDRQTWHETAAVPDHWLHDVAYGDEGFVAVGKAGKILVSEDGENWVTKTINPMRFTLLSVTYADGKYVAAGMGSQSNYPDGGIMTSEDGENWTETHTHSTYTLWDITYGGGTFVAVGGASTGSYYICTSPDGINWTQRSNFASSYAQLFSVNYDSGIGRFIAVGSTNSGGSSGSNKAFVTTSVGGVSWNDRTDATKEGLRVVIIDANDNEYVAMGGTGNIYTSDDQGAS